MQTKECGNCKAINDIHSTHCIDCGQPLHTFRKSSRNPETQSPVRNLSALKGKKVRLCPICETVNDEHAWSCKHCGRSLSVETIVDFTGEKKQRSEHQQSKTDPKSPDLVKTHLGTTEQRICGNCGENINHKGDFCHICGTRLYTPDLDTNNQESIHKTEHQETLTTVTEGLFSDSHNKPPQGAIVDSPSAFSTIRLMYYWANAIINPILLLTMLGSEFDEGVVGFMIVWTVIMGIVNPRIFSYITSLLGGGVVALGSILVDSCAVILFGGIGAIILMAVIVALAAFCFSAMAALGCFLLFVDAVIMLLQHYNKI